MPVLSTADVGIETPANQLVAQGKLRAADIPHFESLTPARAERLTKVVESRTRHVSFCLDGVHGAHNIAAVVRSCDAWGIQELHVTQSQPLGKEPTTAPPQPDRSKRARFRDRNQPLIALLEKDSVRQVSKGAHKWLSIHEYQTPSEAAATLRDRGYRICVSSVSPSAKPLASIDLEAGPIAFVFGNEHSGVSEEMTAEADELFTIPMYGFVESTNVSVAAATVASHVVERARASKSDTFRNSFFLSSNQQSELFHEFLHPKRAQPRNTVGKNRTKCDVTTMGSHVEGLIVRNSAFAPIKDQANVERPDGTNWDTTRLRKYMEDKLRLSQHGGIKMARYFIRRAKIGALGDIGRDDGFSRRSDSLAAGLCGPSALACEAALRPSVESVGSRKTLLPLFQSAIQAMNGEYADLFLPTGQPRFPLSAIELEQRFSSVRNKALEHAWTALNEFASDRDYMSDDCLRELILGARPGDIAQCLAVSAQFDDGASKELQSMATSPAIVGVSLRKCLQTREPYRNRWCDLESPVWSGNPSRSAPYEAKELATLQVALRLAHASEVLHSLHTCFYDREAGRGSGRVASLRYNLIEAMAAESMAETGLLDLSDSDCVARPVFEWCCSIEPLKQFASSTSKSPS